MTASRLALRVSRSPSRAQKARHIPPKELLAPGSKMSLWPSPLTEPQSCRWLEDDTEQPFADRDL